MSQHRRDVSKAFRKEMRKDAPSAPGLLTTYLEEMRRMDEKSADGLEADLIETFTSDSGLRVLKIFEKAALQNCLPLGIDDRALRENNAIRHFVMEIRRFLSHDRHTPST